ncbi:MAG: TRAP transporter large permease subunit [Magnetococcales bacterium]|nr:TRAP transporter large permease subunit [Magnetococcales bacterium]
MIIDLLPSILADYLAGWMFLVLTLLLMAGFPVTFTLMGTALIFAVIGLDLAFFDLLPLRLWGMMQNSTFIAVPLFVFMGVMLEKSGLAESLLETMGQLFRRVRGGLAVSVVVVGALLGASTGIVGATVVTMGLLALPVMLNHGYSKSLATGTVAASGTLGQIIPPSIILVLLGDILGVSVGDLFLGAVVPGLILVALYILYILIVCRLYPQMAPLVPDSDCSTLNRAFWRRIIKTLLPTLGLMVAVLGSIFAGIATPTESGAMGAVGATLLALAHGRFSLSVLRHVAQTTTKLTSMVFIILVGANAFGLVFRGLGGDGVIRDFIENLDFAGWQVLLIVMILIFFLGFFLDFIEICFIHIPIAAPIIADYGFDPLWFGILFAINLQTSFMTPPFGFSLFFLKGVAPSTIRTGHIYRGILPFVGIQLLVLFVVALWPETVTWLPAQIYTP